MKKDTKSALIAALIVLGVVLLTLGSYFVTKHYNNSLYREIVRETIREMVKDEALRK